MSDSPAPTGPDVLTRLIRDVANAPDETRLATLLARELPAVPGVSGAAVCLAGRYHTTASGRVNLPPTCPGSPDAAASGFPQCAGTCRTSRDGGLRRFALAADGQEFGGLLLDVVDADAFTPCAPLVESAAVAAALRIATTRRDPGGAGSSGPPTSRSREAPGR